MVRSAKPFILGQITRVPAGIRGTCVSCNEELVTDGTETAMLVEGGAFTNRGGCAAWHLPCPIDGFLVTFKSNIKATDVTALSKLLV